MGFKEHIASRGNSVSKLREKIEQINGANKQKQDERLWFLKTGKDGKAEAVIRFLPGSEKDNDPFVQVYAHRFKFPNDRWYWQNCPTTVGISDGCPVCEWNGTFYESGDEEKIAYIKAMKSKRQLTYYSNILVIKDPSNPENEGKVFLFPYGVKIMKKIEEAAKESEVVMEDDDDYVPPFDAFHLIDGANFHLKVTKTKDGPNYDESKFLKPKPLFAGNEVKLEELYNGLYFLGEFVDPKQFKTYDELKAKFDSAFKGTKSKPKTEESKQTTTKKKPSVVEDDDDDEVIVETKKKKPVSLEEDDIPEKFSQPMTDGDDDDDLITGLLQDD